MCNTCCKEIKGWCRSCTKTEVALTILQGVLLIVFIVLLTLLIIHLVVCPKDINIDSEILKSTVLDERDDIDTEGPTNTYSTKTFSRVTTSSSTLGPEVECTWKPSEKTKAATHYYENKKTNKNSESTLNDNLVTTLNESSALTTYFPVQFESIVPDIADISDDKLADEVKKGFVLALVKFKSPNDVTYGCILTIIAEFWTLTAASCIESIEEVDSLDEYVMIEGFGEKRPWKSHSVSDVLLHPQYQGTNKNFDMVALKSESSLVKEGQIVVDRPSMLDFLMMTIGEEYTLLGYGRFRSVEEEPEGRGVREVTVYGLPRAQCEDALALRHLAGGYERGQRDCGSRPLCAGTLRARDVPCAYCAGTPLLRARTLLALMADGPCAVACQPALYVNLALVADWLDSVLNDTN